MRVVVVEDEERFAGGLRGGLEAEGFAVELRGAVDRKDTAAATKSAPRLPAALAAGQP
ncbi:hypothetical protein [Streptomyces sp. V1I1]|uniref:hypothetical protein n=1 Tax=Streptomyces sp. V1I1 TaxID=3042272 RepID=UPI0027860B54|nr:hypothetical protein [Streptomyces sp. V1I1]MDQ0941996.1 DNA-binding response OmpR family regulator [Streptomyces sp. V1I1]